MPLPRPRPRRWGAPALVALALAAGPQPAVAQAIQVEQLVKGTRSWDGSPLPPLGPGQPEVTVLRITLPAGASLPLHVHPVINAGVLLEGRMRVSTATGETITLEAGDGLIELVNTPHQGTSLGPGPARILVVYVGLEGQALSLPARP
ncbi:MULTISPECIES: cupin domain-containing protein [Aphanothece]|uniref:cupin domain-containing protein n=1 Tax=Aphanothece TaxID=1121 RepID=UPI0039855CDB